MEVTARRSGGIAGFHDRIGPVDTTQASNGAAIEAKIEEIGFFGLPDQLSDGSGVSDALFYEVSASAAGQQHTVSFSDPPGDAGLEELIGLLAASGTNWEDEPLGSGGDPQPGGGY